MATTSNATDPGTASSCAAGAARTCQRSIALANAVNSATAAQPTSASPRRARQVAKSAPSVPITGSTAIGKAVLKACL